VGGRRVLILTKKQETKLQKTLECILPKRTPPKRNAKRTVHVTPQMELLFFYMSRICSIVIEHIAQLPVPQDCRWWGWLSECSVWEAEPKPSPFVAIGSPSKMWSRCAIDVSLVESASKVLPKRTPPIRTQSKTISFDPRLQGEVHLVRDRWSCCSFSYQEDLAVLFVGK
jgi:hypothetical protein